MGSRNAPLQPDVGEQWKLTCARFGEWLHEEALSFPWWVMLALFVVTTYIWWKKADKSRLVEIVLYTSMVMVFIIATTIMACVFCFVCEPIFVWGGVYKMIRWKSYYGFPIYIFIAAASKFCVHLISSISAGSKRCNRMDVQ